MALTAEKKLLLAKIGVGLVIVGMLCGYTYVWLNWLDLEDAREAALIWHNFYRSRHGSPPLRRSADLNMIAQMCADYYNPLGQVNHKCPYRLDGKNYYLDSGTGENGFGVTFGDYSNRWSRMEVAEVGSWALYKEIYYFNFSDYNASIESGKTGHFTQLLWKDSKDFGFGYTIYYNKAEDKYGALGVFLFYQEIYMMLKISQLTTRMWDQYFLMLGLSKGLIQQDKKTILLSIAECMPTACKSTSSTILISFRQILINISPC